jgi:hypothetical protein
MSEYMSSAIGRIGSSAVQSEEAQESLWVAASQQGDSLAFNRLVLKWEKAIYNLSLRLLRDREEAAANQQKFLESLKELYTPLIEALANYGDSLAQVKPGEYINLILYTETLDTESARSKDRHDVISAQKSWITDYKTGRMTLDSFKQKVLQYSE